MQKQNKLHFVSASFSAVKQAYCSFMYDVPENLALYGENMFGIHSIECMYQQLGNTLDNALNSYFYLFAILDVDKQEWLSFDDVCTWAKTFDIPTVPIVHRGTFTNLQEVEKWMNSKMKQKSIFSTSVTPEGFVIRNANAFKVNEFDKNVAKYVRAGHVQTDQNWSKTWKSAKLIK